MQTHQQRQTTEPTPLPLFTVLFIN